MSLIKLSWKSLLVVLVGFCCFSGRSSLAVQEWNNSNTGDWFTAANWTPAGVPNSAQAASINNGGEATASAGGPLAALQIDVGKNGGTGDLSTANVDFNVQSSLDIGDVEATFAVGNVNISSSGSATITDANSLMFGLSGLGDVNVGQTSAGIGATAQGTGQLTVERIVNWQLPEDLDLGQTSGSGTATGTGTANIREIDSLLSIGGDLDVGQTSATASGVNSGNGTLTLERAVELQIGADLDIGQSTGDGQSTGTGTVSISRLDMMTIGDSLDVAKIRALNSAFNNSTAFATLNDMDLSVGFSAANAGSIEIARVLTTESARGVGTGTLILDQVDALVANDVIVGELALGGTNANSSASGMLQLLDSRLDTRDLSVGVRLNGTAGSVQGTVELTRSLLIVQSVMTLSSNSTLRMQIDGTTRALGDGLVGDYAAVDADAAIVGGVLAIESNPVFLGPATRGSIDTFELIRTLFGLTGSFDETTYDGVLLGAGPTYVGASNGGEDGLFVEVTETGSEVIMAAYLALPGDANGDRTVDGADFLIWNANKFTGGNDWTTGDFNGDGNTDGADFLTWNNNKFTSADVSPVPEPCGLSLWWLGTVMLLVWRSGAGARIT